jgi:hypothetical protein
VRGEDTFIGHLLESVTHRESKEGLFLKVESRTTMIQGDHNIGGEGISSRDQVQKRKYGKREAVDRSG